MVYCNQQPKQYVPERSLLAIMAQKKKKREAGSGTIYKRPDGRWIAQYTSGRDPETGKLRRHTVYGKTQQEVAEKLRAATAKIDNGTFQEPNKITVEEYAKEYMKNHVSTLAPLTQVSYEKNLRIHILPSLGKKKLTDLNRREVQAFVSSLGKSGKDLAPKTIRVIHGILHALLSAAKKDEIILRNVADDCTLPRVTQTRAKAITTVQLESFLKAIKQDKFYHIYYLDIFSGLREAEILGLRWEDVEWETDSIVIRQQLQIVPHTKPTQYRLVPPKENKERRIVLAKSAMQTLRQQRIKQQKQKLQAGALWNNSYHLIFTNEFGEPLHHFSVYSHLKRILKECGMEGYTFHSLRHSFATISIENGDDIKTVQANLGHHAAAFTLKTYAHVSNKMQQNSAARMEELISSLAAK